MLKTIKNAEILSKMALKNIAAASTPETTLPDDLVKLLHDLLPESGDYERILPLVEEIYEEYVVGAKTMDAENTAREVLESVLMKETTKFSIAAFKKIFAKKLISNIEIDLPEVPNSVPRTELNPIKIPIEKKFLGGTLEGKLNMVPHGKNPAAINIDLPKNGGTLIELFKQEMVVNSGDFTTKVAQLNIAQWIKGIFKIEEFFGDVPDWVTGGVDVSIGEFTGSVKPSKKDKNPVEFTLFNVTLNLKMIIPSEGPVWFMGNNTVLDGLRAVVDSDIEVSLTFPVTTSLNILEAVDNKLLKKVIADQKKLEKEYSKAISNLGEYFNNQDDLDKLRGDGIKNMQEVFETRGKYSKPQRLKMIERVAEQSKDPMLKEWIAKELKKQDNKFAKFKKQFAKLQELSSKLKKLENEFIEKAAKISSTLVLRACWEI